MRNLRPSCLEEPVPYFQDSSGVFYCNDHIDVLKRLPGQSIDLVITAPPDFDHRMTLCYQFDYRSLVQQLFRVLKIGGVIIWIVSECLRMGSETLDVADQKVYFVRHAGFIIQQTMIHLIDVCHTCPEEHRNMVGFEYMIVFSKGMPKTYNTTLSRNGNVWTDNETEKSSFAKNIIRDNIVSWSNPGDVILDPMAGQGIVMREAAAIGRKWVGIEIQEKLCQEFIKIYQENKTNLT